MSPLLALVACSPVDTAAPDAGALDGALRGDDASIHDDADANAAPGEAFAHADTLARAAVVLGSCWEDDGINRFLSNLWSSPSIPQVWGRLTPHAACLASAGGGCQALEKCVGYRVTLRAGECTGGCRGEVFHTCGQTHQLAIDCAKLGLKCDPLAVCAEAKASACERETFTPSCGGDQKPLTCNDHYVEHGPDCAALGLRCADGVCKGAGEACTFFGPERQYRVEYPALGCAGNALHACVGGARHDVDCSAFGPGFSCRERDGKFFCGLTAECMPGNHPDADQRGSEVTCDGSKINFCNAGRWDQVDCKALGFRDCDSAHQICTPSFFEPIVR